MDFARPVEAVIPGAQGRILGVLTNTSAELNLRTIARLSNVSPAQASRVLPRLVDLGIIERRDVPPSALYRLVPQHVVSGLIITLARAAEEVLHEMGRIAGTLPIPPVSIIVFGSFARFAADSRSDIDVVVVRPSAFDDDDTTWAEALEQLHHDVHVLSGNRVNMIEISECDATKALNGRSQLWAEIRRDGRVVHGRSIDQLRGRRSG
jgi:predicted nucleotidyltransferase